MLLKEGRPGACDYLRQAARLRHTATAPAGTSAAVGDQ